MSLRTRLAALVAPWAIKNVDSMTGEQLVTAIWGRNSGSSRYGSQELLKAYSTMPWLRAVVGRVSWASSCVPWQLFVATSKPERGLQGKVIRRRDIARNSDPVARIKAYKNLREVDSLREITEHPALEFLDRGNARFPGVTAGQVTQQHLDLIGEAVWLIERNAMGLPMEYYPIPPTWVVQTPWDTARNRLNAEPGLWMLMTEHGTLHVPPGDIVYFYHPDPEDPYSRGRGIGHALGDELETDEATAKHLKRWFKNFAIPPLIISRKNGTGMAKGSTDRLEEAWMSKLAGRNNTPFFSTQELQVTELNQTFKDMELSTLRKDERDIIIHVYGVPPEIFGILANSNRSTIDAADYFMGKYVVVPRLEFKRAVLQHQLIERYDDRLILDYVSPVLEDKEFELRVMTAAPQNFEIDEFRSLANRRGLDGDQGKGFFVPISSTYVKNLAELEETEFEPVAIESEEPESEPVVVEGEDE